MPTNRAARRGTIEKQMNSQNVSNPAVGANVYGGVARPEDENALVREYTVSLSLKPFNGMARVGSCPGWSARDCCNVKSYRASRGLWALLFFFAVQSVARQ